ncbi:hypothetical protein FIBSPDRAFT_938868 [Athelia psychrophila]|uniref:Uncharacterized protein n=1 Tax=Athelia psychrophila TaxID=1759441 RepID=A0A165XLY2_9AGAM|nr:hypothetical protein FIBSPDRAFT_938868 [Fibularhizoctonia sp. CBS 109695]
MVVTECRRNYRRRTRKVSFGRLVARYSANYSDSPRGIRAGRETRGHDSGVGTCITDADFGADTHATYITISCCFVGQTSHRVNVNHLSDLTNKITHLYSGALYHLFDEATQYAIAVRMATLIKRATGSVIFGRHQGLEPDGMIADAMARVRYGHSPASWKRLWHRVFIELEGIQFAEERVKIDAEFAESFQYGNMDARMMYWSVSIL